MRKILLTTLAITATLMAMAPAADNVLPKGFTALFNDRDFTGWQARQGGVESEVEKAEWREHWKVEDGMIKFDGQGPTLWTSRKFKDFVLMVDWRFPKSGDTGVYLRGNSKSQVNIWCDEMGSGEVWGYRTDENLSEEVRKACTPIKKMDKPVGQWNTFAIAMKFDCLTVELNGEVVINNAQLPGVPGEGEIGLQQHGSPIEFKNIYLKEVATAAEPAGGAPARADEKAQAVIDEVEKECVNRGIRLLAPEKAKRLAELVRQVKPRVVVECGTAVGYSGLWIARELKAAGAGKLITIEIDAGLSREAEANFRKAGLAEYVTLRVGDARKIVKELKGPIDFVFLDCGPANYHACFLGLEDRLKKGAIVVADNAGYGAREMAEYLKHVRSKYNSSTEWFDIDLPWAKRDAIEVTIISPRQPKQE
jgi:predicted O-methyltransferase YrrM